MDRAFGAAPASNPVLRYMAILSAARDFGVNQDDRERIANRFDPFDTPPRKLADELADVLLRDQAPG